MADKSTYRALASVSPLVRSIIRGEETFTGRLEELLAWMENGQVSDLFKYYCRDLDTLDSCPLSDEEIGSMMRYYHRHSKERRAEYRKQAASDTLISSVVFGAGRLLWKHPRLRPLSLLLQGIGGIGLGGTSYCMGKYLVDAKRVEKQLPEWRDALYRTAGSLDDEVRVLFSADLEQ